MFSDNYISERYDGPLSNRDITTIILLKDKDNELRSDVVYNRLHELTSSLTTYSSTCDCIDYVRQMNEKEKVVIIITNAVYSQPFISILEDLKQISALFIIDDTVHHGEKRIRRFNNIASLLEHTETMIQHKRNHAVVFRYFNQDQRLILDLSKEKATFMWAQLALAVLQQLPSTKNSLEEMITFCTDFYNYDDTELQLIEEFRQTYRSQDAIKWYSRSCFIFRLVNTVLRMEDIDGLFTFRQFIVDLHAQIANEQRQQREIIHTLRVYRGQMLPMSELNHLQMSIGNLVSSNGFFSTSTDQHVAEVFAGNYITENFVSVIFNIDVDMSLESTLCADISKLSTIPDEYEVLFSLSSVFRLQAVRHDAINNRWEVDLIASDEGRETLEEYKNLMLVNNEEISPYLLFGRILFEMGLYEKAIRYFDSVKKLLPTDDWNIWALLNILQARALFLQGKYNDSLVILLEALTILENHDQGPESIAFLQCRFNIANVYVFINKYQCALEIYRQTLDAQCKLLPTDHRHIADSLSGISWALGYLNDTEQALQYSMESLAMRQRCLPSCHPSITHTLRAIGQFHESEGRFDEALEYFSRAHKATVKYLSPTHVHQAFSLLHLGIFSENKGEYESALDYYLQALTIYEHNFKQGHPSIANVLDFIGNIYRRKKDFKQALDYLHKALDMRSKILPPDHLTFSTTYHCLANIYLDTGENCKAIEYFTEALETKKKHLKSTDASVSRTLSCLATAYSHNDQLELAQQTFEQVLATQQTVHPKGHPDIGVTMHHMASNYQRMNNTIKALELYEKSLAMNKLFFPENHLEITQVENKIRQLTPPNDTST